MPVWHKLHNWAYICKPVKKKFSHSVHQDEEQVDTTDI